MSLKWIGKEREYHKSIGSTNDRAKELAHKGAPHGMIIVAEEQLHGKGRNGRTWVSTAGAGIWMSLILRPSFSPERAPIVTILAALSTATAIQSQTGLETWIKWPNDIIVNNKKACGILTEIQAIPDKIEYIVVGIGVNVNNEKEDFSAELSPSATSLRMEAGRVFDKEVILERMLGEFEGIYDEYANTGDFNKVHDMYQRKCITLNKHVRVIGRTEEFDGMAVGLSEDCGLLVRTPDNTIKKVYSGDVSVRGIAGYI